MTATSAEYYEAKYADFQRGIDNLAWYEDELEREIETVKAEAENEEEDVIYAINEYIIDNDEDLALHDLAIGSGAFYKLTEVRDRAIAYFAKKRLDKRLNDKSY